MPRQVKPLTDTAVRQAKPKAEDYSLADGNGLNLMVSTLGSKLWAVRYQKADSKRGVTHVGKYPEVSLADARRKAEEVHLAARTGGVIPSTRNLKRLGAEQLSAEDLAVKKKEEEARANSFLVWSEAWLAREKAGWAKSTYDKAEYVIQKLLQPKLKDMDMRTMRTRDIVEVIEGIATHAPTLAQKAVTYLNGVAGHCIRLGIRDDDQLFRTKKLVPKFKKGHIPAVTRENGLGPLMRAIKAYPGYMVRSALRLAAWTVLRPGIVASARWAEFDLNKAEWHVPGLNDDGSNRMKTGHDHIVSLPTQAVAMLREMFKITGGDEFVFAAVGKARNPHLNRDALSKALRDMGFQGVHATHGFRATLRTLAKERLGIDRDVLEAQLAHAKKDDIQAAYDRTKFDDERRAAMQLWADYLDAQEAGKELSHA